jgi:hypothetical protein
MNELKIAVEGVQNEVNPFGIQLEEPMSNNVGKGLYHKPYGLVIDAVKQDSYPSG